MTTWLFGYGSLIAEPEADHEVHSRHVGTLTGFRRAFNKRSIPRGCRREDAFEVDFSLPEGFVADGFVASLALGTEPDPTAQMVGLTLGYHLDGRGLALTDEREGFATGAGPTNSYLRTQLPVTLDDGREVQAWTYLSNEYGIYHLDPATPLLTRAQILVAATPRPDVPQHRALGLHYLELVRTGLRRLGHVDPRLEELAEAILSLPGPWCDLVAAPDHHRSA